MPAPLARNALAVPGRCARTLAAPAGHAAGPHRCPASQRVPAGAALPGRRRACSFITRSRCFRRSASSRASSFSLSLATLASALCFSLSSFSCSCTHQATASSRVQTSSRGGLVCACVCVCSFLGGGAARDSHERKRWGPWKPAFSRGPAARKASSARWHEAPKSAGSSAAGPHASGEQSARGSVRRPGSAARRRLSYPANLRRQPLLLHARALRQHGGSLLLGGQPGLHVRLGALACGAWGIVSRVFGGGRCGEMCVCGWGMGGGGGGAGV
jgi:hypothetical protein